MLTSQLTEQLCQWDVDAAREIFQDDALIVSAFVLSTILMLVLGFFLRWVVAVRTLLEAVRVPVLYRDGRIRRLAAAGRWHMRPFNVTQQVLRNRILGVEAGFKSRAWQSEQRRIMAKIQRAPHRASHLQHAMLRGDLPDMTLAEWDARFLSAKVSYCLERKFRAGREQSLHSLASTFLETQKDVKAGGRVSKRFSRKRPEESNQGSLDAKSGSETRLGGRRIFIFFCIWVGRFFREDAIRCVARNQKRFETGARWYPMPEHKVLMANLSQKFLWWDMSLGLPHVACVTSCELAGWFRSAGCCVPLWAPRPPERACHGQTVNPVSRTAVRHLVSWKGCRGSVLPYGALFALPGTIATAILHLTWNPELKGSENVEVSRFGDVWTAYTFSLGFLVVFRNNQAYNRFWEGASKVHEIRGEIRLISLLFATCMSEISLDEDDEAPDDMMQVIDLTGIDRQSLDHLECAPSRCEVIVQWITRLMIQALRAKLGLNRSTMDLAMAIVDIYRVRKIKEVPFPFPYSQMVLLMLAVYTFVTPVIASQLIDSSMMATLATFCVTTAFWSLYQIADEIDQPFGTDPNDLPMQRIQTDFNDSLLFLMRPETQCVPPFVRPSTAMRLTKVTKKDHIGSGRKVSAASMEQLIVASPVPAPSPAPAPPEVVPLPRPVRKKPGVKKKRRTKTPPGSEAEVVVIPFEVQVEDGQSDDQQPREQSLGCSHFGHLEVSPYLAEKKKQAEVLRLEILAEQLWGTEGVL
eukprot:s2059_g8.t1